MSFTEMFADVENQVETTTTTTSSSNSSPFSNYVSDIQPQLPDGISVASMIVTSMDIDKRNKYAELLKLMAELSCSEAREFAAALTSVAPVSESKIGVPLANHVALAEQVSFSARKEYIEDHFCRTTITVGSKGLYMLVSAHTDSIDVSEHTVSFVIGDASDKVNLLRQGALIKYEHTLSGNFLTLLSRKVKQQIVFDEQVDSFVGSAILSVLNITGGSVFKATALDNAHRKPVVGTIIIKEMNTIVDALNRIPVPAKSLYSYMQCDFIAGVLKTQSATTFDLYEKIRTTLRQTPTMETKISAVHALENRQCLKDALTVVRTGQHAKVLTDYKHLRSTLGSYWRRGLSPHSVASPYIARAIRYAWFAQKGVQVMAADPNMVASVPGLRLTAAYTPDVSGYCFFHDSVTATPMSVTNFLTSIPSEHANEFHVALYPWEGILDGTVVVQNYTKILNWLNTRDVVISYYPDPRDPIVLLSFSKPRALKKQFDETALKAVLMQSIFIHYRTMDAQLDYICNGYGAVSMTVPSMYDNDHKYRSVVFVKSSYVAVEAMDDVDSVVDAITSVVAPKVTQKDLPRAKRLRDVEPETPMLPRKVKEKKKQKVDDSGPKSPNYSVDS